MKAILDLIFFMLLIGAIIVYPMYFFELYKFKESLKLADGRLWSNLSSANYSEMSAAYKALHAIRDGQILGVPISTQSLALRRKALFLLYLGLSIFLAFLFLGLVDAIQAKGS